MILYLDNGATTRTSERVVQAMLPYFHQQFGNASSGHQLGLDSRNALEASRRVILDAVGCGRGRVVFTSGGTEANGLALNTGMKGSAGNVVSGALEHSSIRKGGDGATVKGLEWRVPSIGATGVHTVEEIMACVDDSTRMVSLMMANNEIGTVQPVEELGRTLRATYPHIWFHVDGVQAFTKVSIDMDQMGITSLSLSAHKIHGPPGVGALVVSGERAVHPYLVGGGQEDGMRPGTENVPGIVGFAEAVREVQAHGEAHLAIMKAARDQFIEALLAKVPGSRVNGHREHRLCNNAHFSFESCRSGPLLELFEERGVLASAGSACHAGKSTPSAVMEAIGVPRDVATIRFTLSRETPLVELLSAVDRIADAVELARKSDGVRSVP